MAEPRRARVARKTRETEIEIAVDLDGRGEARIDTPVGFLTHMLEALARHALIDLEVRATGDTHVDLHHTVEDIGLVLGQALGEALGGRGGIRRAGWARHPMDEALADVAIDLSGRTCLVYEATYAGTHVGELPLELLHDLFEALARTLGCALHIDVVRGRSDHHRVEAVFKALAHALRQAIAVEPRLEGASPSTKGGLDLPGRSAPAGGGGASTSTSTITSASTSASASASTGAGVCVNSSADG